MKILFAGPSLAGAVNANHLAVSRIINKGPVKRGGIVAAVAEGATAIGIVDGTFEETLSVWHKEILFALDNGVAVAGAASMGALRAAECAAFGMRGIGVIFENYANGLLQSDADVAQVHAPAELGYAPLSEPIVNVIPTLAKAAAAGLLAEREAAALLQDARQMSYKSRTYPRMLNASGNFDTQRRESLARWFETEAVNQKQVDALRLLDWLRAQPDHRSDQRSGGWSFSDTSHWYKLLEDVLPTCRRVSGPEQFTQREALPPN